MHAVLLGASRGIGYYTTLNLLSSPSAEWTCILLLRKLATLESDEKLQPHIDSGRLKLIQGDATNESDVGKLFTGHVDLVVTSVGTLLHLIDCIPSSYLENQVVHLLSLY